MFATLSLFDNIISSVAILRQEQRTALSITKLKVVFNDKSVIFLREIIIENVLVDYSYHWQNADGKLLIRWDNAAHYPGISTFPHHKHEETENNVLASEQLSLIDVFNFIKNVVTF